MLELMKARKEELEKRGEKGFTLMEMLIVIAIIAILIAIAVPIFTSQLAAARAATDEANIRSGYAQVQSEIMLAKAGELEEKYTLKTDGTIDGATDYSAQGNSADATNANDGGEVDIAGIPVQWSEGNAIVYYVDTDKKEIEEIKGANN